MSGVAGRTSSAPALAVRVVCAAGLLVDAVVHLQLAANYQLAAPAGLGQGNLFRIEAVVAIVVAVLVLARGSRIAYAAAFLVGASALTAVLLYRYVEVPAVGPIPSMYEPVWFSKKTVSAIAAAVATVAAVVGVLATTGSNADQSDLSHSSEPSGRFHRRGSSPPALFKEEV